MAAFMVHAEILASLDLDRDEARVRIEEVAEGTVSLSGPPGRTVEVIASRDERLRHAGTTDWRLRSADPATGVTRRATFDEAGRVVVDVSDVGEPRFVDVLLRYDDGEVEEIATARRGG